MTNEYIYKEGFIQVGLLGWILSGVFFVLVVWVIFFYLRVVLSYVQLINPF